MERRRIWWLVAGGSNTVVWERVALLAIPFTRENHCSILAVYCDERRGCTAIGVITSLPSRGLYYATGDSVILKAMAQGSQPMVSKPVGVWTAWCVGVESQDRF